MASIYLNHPQLQKQVIIPPRPLEDMNPEMIMEALENVLQNEENLNVAEGFEIQCGVARMERG